MRADEADRPGFHGFRPFRRIAQDQNRFAKRRRFFLDAAGIGQYQIAEAHEVGKGFIFHGVDEMDPVDAGQFIFDDLADFRVAVDGKDDFRIGNLFDDMAHGLAEVFPTVRRQEDDSVVLEVHRFQLVAEVIVAGNGRHQGVDDGIPRYVNLRRIYIFTDEIGPCRRGRGKMNGRNGPGELAVHFFRERRIYIPCPKAGFDVADGDLLIIGRQGPGKGRRRIAVNEDQIRLFFGQDILETQERLRRNIV